MDGGAPRPISIAIAALGGQGGGVLADWIVDVAEGGDYLAQTTSVPGVAQRTGATIYYLELFPEAEAKSRGQEPVLALYPVPGDVDIVLASELMEAGRAIQRGLVTPDRTALIASSHRVYAISERVAMGDGTVDAQPILEAGRAAARRFICFDMDAAAERSECVISAVLLGALAGCGSLPFERQRYEEVIRRSGRAVEANLAGFAEGYAAAQGALSGEPAALRPSGPQPAAVEAIPEARDEPTSDAASALLARMRDAFPEGCHSVLREGLRRTSDYQDLAYAREYLDWLEPILALDRRHGGEAHGYALTRETARYLALRMSYEDTIRVADLKTRTSRFRRFREEVRAGPDQLVYVTEFMHPRVEEICDALPARLGRYVMQSPRLRRTVDRMVNKARKLDTTKLSGFLALYTVAGFRRWRRGTYRYRIEQARIQSWLDRVAAAVPASYALATELVACARVIKGYGDTHARSLRNFERIMTALGGLPDGERAAQIARELRDAALADETGAALDKVMEQLASEEPAPPARRQA